MIVAIFLILVGSLLFVGALAVQDFDFKALGTRKFEKNTYEITEPFDSISIHATTAEIKLVRSENESCRVEFYEAEKDRYQVSVQNGTLTICKNNTKRWYEHIGISFEEPKMTIYLPEGEYQTLFVQTNTGDVDIPSYFSFESIDIEGNTSDIVCRAPTTDRVQIHVDTGDVMLSGMAGEIIVTASTGRIELTELCCASLYAESSTGKIFLKNVIAEAELKLESSTGDVVLDGCDAGAIFVRTSTGDVTGSLLSAKIFRTSTSTGHVDVPQATTGGTCDIQTSTGDIQITVS